MSEFIFPVGYHKFHKAQLFNFQLNRWYSLGYTRKEDREEAGRRITNFRIWKLEMLNLAEKALSERRMLNAAFYYRAAEFYTKSNDPDKASLYDKFIRALQSFHESNGNYEVPAGEYGFMGGGSP